MAFRFLFSLTLACAQAARASDPALILENVPLVVDETFPADDYIRHQARFWGAIYLRVGEDEGLLHDPMFPEIVFRKIDAPRAGKRGAKLLEATTGALRSELRATLQIDSSQWTPEQRRMRALLPLHWDSAAVDLCAERLRFQRGLRAKFRQGVERSYRYLPAIESVFAARGLPPRLKYLPHVESSFHPHAYSKVGAAGMWQFMKSTGRRFLQVGYYIDERRDPMVSSEAAARMLLRNHAILKSWPLAVMGYNHGPGGVARAVASTGSSDIGVILQSYYSNTFGFASRNFYAEFLAASSIALLADSLFPNLDKWEPLPSQSVRLSRAVSARQVSEWTGLSLAELEEFNLALRPAVFRGKATLPKGYALRLPPNTDTSLLTLRLASATAIKVAATSPAPTDKVETERIAQAASPAPRPKRGSTIKAATAKDTGFKEPPSFVAQTEPQAKVLDKPEPAMRPMPPSPTLPAHGVVDSSFSLLLSDWEKVAHPWDRFQPAVYNLEYSYQDGTLVVRVGPDETLSHFSDWSGLPGSVIRRANGLRRADDFRMQRQIKLRLPTAAADSFVKRREEYFRGMEEDFYARYHVESLEPLVAVRGTNAWNLALERETPYWLFLKHNPGRRLDALRPGDTLKVPVVAEGWRHWGFTRYAGTSEYLEGVHRFLYRPVEATR